MGSPFTLCCQHYILTCHRRAITAVRAAISPATAQATFHVAGSVVLVAVAAGRGRSAISAVRSDILRATAPSAAMEEDVVASEVAVAMGAAVVRLATLVEATAT